MDADDNPLRTMLPQSISPPRQTALAISTDRPRKGAGRRWTVTRVPQQHAALWPECETERERARQRRRGTITIQYTRRKVSTSTFCQHFVDIRRSARFPRSQTHCSG